jgi:hypothetical protein
MDVFQYYKDLRDKHIIHDENPYSQAFTAVALNTKDSQFKVADIVSLSMNILTTDKEHIQSFSQLVQFTYEWVKIKHEELHNKLGAEYEKKDYETLLLLPDVIYQKPNADKVSEKR